MRLIDADALKYTRVRIFHGILDNGEPLVGGMNAVVMSCAIKDAPTIEAEPVKHGRWYDIVEFNNGERIIATCSNCKDRGELRTDRNEWGIWHINSPRCPNCGAKMNLEVTNGLDQH